MNTQTEKQAKQFQTALNFVAHQKQVKRAKRAQAARLLAIDSDYDLEFALDVCFIEIESPAFAKFLASSDLEKLLEARREHKRARQQFAAQQLLDAQIEREQNPNDATNAF